MESGDNVHHGETDDINSTDQPNVTTDDVQKTTDPIVGPLITNHSKESPCTEGNNPSDCPYEEIPSSHLMIDNDLYNSDT